MDVAPTNWLADERRATLKDIAFDLMSSFVGKADNHQAVQDCIERIGTICRAGRAYVFQFRERGSLMDNTHEWCATGVDPQKESLQGLNTAIFPWWMAQLSSGQQIHILSVADLPPEASAEKEILEPQGIKSLLVLPFSINGILGGFVGFDNVRHTGSWSARDFRLLQTSADIIGNAFERQWRHSALLEAKNAAEQAARSAAEFADYVAHEIRTPLTSVVATAEALEASGCGEDQCELVALIKEGAAVLTSIVNQTLEYSRTKAGRITLEKRPFDLAQMVQTRVAIHRPVADCKGVKLKTDMAPSAFCKVVGDSQRLGQVLGNLIGNAVKFTEGGEVRIEAACEENAGCITARFSVADTGPGIAPAAIPTLFHRFSQESPATARLHGGSGLGLAICRLLVEQMGGEIYVVSNLGKGCVFHFSVQFKALEGEVSLAD